MNFFGETWTERDMETYAGRPEQLYGVRLAELSEGRERGVRVADVWNGGGWQFTVLLDRGLDIGSAFFRGVPLAFLTPGDFAAPAFATGQGNDWLRNWGGGLVTGCGLRNVGRFVNSGEEAFGLHGRLSLSPARDVRTGKTMIGGKLTLYVEGTLHEARLFGENLRLHRRISSPVGGDTVWLEDTVTNAGFQPEPVFVLYHINWGFPMVCETATLEAAGHKPEPRDESARAGIHDWMKMQPPTPAYAEQVFYHDLPAGEDGFAAVVLSSPVAGLRAEVACRKAELPLLVQWKQMGQGAYVTGLEPANCRVDGRDAELAGTPHCVLEPGASRSFAVRLRITPRE